MKHRKADIRASDTCYGLGLSPIVNRTQDSDSTTLKTPRYVMTIVLVWRMQISAGTEQSPGSWICIWRLQMPKIDLNHGYYYRYLSRYPQSIRIRAMPYSFATSAPHLVSPAMLASSTLPSSSTILHSKATAALAAPSPLYTLHHEIIGLHFLSGVGTLRVILLLA